MATGRIPTTANSPLTAKGDLFTFSTGSAKLAVGNNGETLVADSSTSTGLRYNPSQAAGKNAIINGAFDIWQRGTSFTAGNAYTADRWYLTGTVGAVTISRESTTVNAGSLYSLKIAPTGAAGVVNINQAIETLNAIKFANQTVTLSVAAAATASTTISTQLWYSTSTDNAVGGSWTQITATSGGSGTVSTSTFTTISGVYTVPSTAKSLLVVIVSSGTAGQSAFLDNVQLELGSVVTTFQTATGTIQGELAACQRYYYRISDPNGTQLYTAITVLHDNSAQNSTTVYGVTANPVPMRTTPISTEFSQIAFHRNDGTLFAISAVTNDAATDSIYGTMYNLTVSGVTAGNVGRVLGNNNSGAYFAVNAEL